MRAVSFDTSERDNTTKTVRTPHHSGNARQLRLEGVTFSYGQSTVLREVDLVVERGEFVSILGPSGCGKTTLLRIIAGLQRPQQGRIMLGDTDITLLPPERRPLGMVFQDLALFPHLSVSENVAFSLAVAGEEKRSRLRRAAELLELVGLAGFGTRSIGQLSGGQRQRVALARSIIAEPELLLLDEPLGALDAAIRREMQVELKALQKRLNVTFVFVTHDQSEAMSMSNRVVVMNHGRIEQDASPYEAYNNPTSAFAASFIGETNLFDGTVLETGSDYCIISISGFTLRVPRQAPSGTTPNSPIILSLRPTDFELVSALQGSDCVRGKVVAQSYFGAEVMLDVDSVIGHLRIRRPASAELAIDLTDRSVVVQINSAAAQLFLNEEA